MAIPLKTAGGAIQQFAAADAVNVGGVSIIGGSVDPSAGGGVAASEGSLYLRDAGTTGSVYLKTGAADTAWLVLATEQMVQQPASRVVSGTTDTVLAADIGNVMFVSQAAGCTATLNDLSASLVAGRMLLLTWQCEGAATILTIDPGTSVTINGSTSNYVAAIGRSRVSLFSRDGLAWFLGTP